jgi:hypothetical protein
VSPSSHPLVEMALERVFWGVYANGNNSLGTIYNSLPGQNQKDIIETWAKDLYPEAWGELEKLGQRTEKEGHRNFNMAKEVIKA